MTTQCALVTGANRGIGLAIVRGLAAQGFVVYLGSRDLAAGVTAATGIDGDIRAIRLDVTSTDDIDEATRHIDTEVGHLDALINNAGVNVGYHRPIEENSSDLRKMYAVNVFAVVDVTNAFLPLLRKSPAGRIVNVTSKRGSIGEDGAWVGTPSMAYSSSKTALNALTVHYARDLADTPIKVNGAAPGHVATDFNGFRGTRSPDEGAAVAIRLATLDVDGPTGLVFEDDTVLTW
ncbi:SDR family oxidoreductase [Rhodococcus ruber]|uniref:SDR family oxidoreductase n=1 Tax=Rhodococcus ruber TaxID=1830 RepID=A0ABT4MIG2_9NOCA|nr:SDR family oxidoreductase [Rhodococcus ruber]MCZ4520777.1 SDR family oxidoreductase [Rhodococcus ruber]